MAKEGSSDYKKVRKILFFKEPLTEWFFVEPKMVILWHCCEEPFKHLYFATVIIHGSDMKMESNKGHI